MPDKPRFGRRRIDRMLKEWHLLREAIRTGDLVSAQTALDSCEEWIDFAFGKSSEKDS